MAEKEPKAKAKKEVPEGEPIHCRNCGVEHDSVPKENVCMACGIKGKVK